MRRVLQGLRTRLTGDPDTLSAPVLDSFDAYHRHRQTLSTEYDRRRSYERSFMDRGEHFTVEGFCWLCQRSVDFRVDYQYAYEVDGVLIPNWREHLVCPSCGLNNRMRAAVHLFEDLFAPSEKTHLFITEQGSPICHRLRQNSPALMESEYLGDRVPLGSHDAKGQRNEDLTALTFAEASFDHILSFDVLEHVPDYQRALRECFRVLKPGGTLFFTAPFLLHRPENTVRAVLLDSGEIEHRLPPEYHYDPVTEEGCLAFYHFGWELLDDLRQLGFTEVAGHLVWSKYFAYLGNEQIILCAQRPA